MSPNYGTIIVIRPAETPADYPDRRTCAVRQPELIAGKRASCHLPPRARAARGMSTAARGMLRALVVARLGYLLARDLERSYAPCSAMVSSTQACHVVVNRPSTLRGRSSTHAQPARIICSIIDIIGNRELEGRSPSKSPRWGASGGKAATCTPLKGNSWGPAAPKPPRLLL